MHIKKILVGTDFSQHSLKAVKVADLWAKKYGAELFVLHASEVVTGNDFPLLGNFQNKQGLTYADFVKSEITKNLEVVTKNLVTPQTHIKAEVVLGSPKSVLLDHIKNYGADLLVIGAHGKNWLNDLLLGSVSHHLINFCPTSVLIVKDETKANPEKIKVALDLSPNAEKLIHFVHDWQKSHQSFVDICHIVEANPESYFGASGVDSLTEYKNLQDLLEDQKKLATEKIQQLTKNLDKNLVSIKIEKTQGFNPAEHILKLLNVSKSDLLVMASNKKGKLESLIMGSVAEKLAQKSVANTLILR